MLRESFDRDWYVQKVGENSVVGPVTLPYDAMIFEARDPETRNASNTGFYPGGTYKYSKRITPPIAWDGRFVGIEFEGVYMRSEVFVNGVLVGGRPSGYAEFILDLTGHLKLGVENLIEVVAHNDEEPNSRWYSGSGIYRPTHLLVADATHITARGVRITTDAIGGSTAALTVDVEVASVGASAPSVVVEVDIVDQASAVVAQGTTSVDLNGVEPARVDISLAVEDPALWSAESPALYAAQVRLLSAGTVIDSARETFGIRTVEVDAVRGLRVNGEVVKLRGACIHHDNGVIGAHELDAAAQRRVRKLKEAGYNAIRSSHNPISSALRRASDAIGMYVMDELTDVWIRGKVANDSAREFLEWWERDLAAMIDADFNHPSVIMLSIGNEIGETSQPSGIELTRLLAEKTRELDPTRPVTNGVNGFLNVITSSDAKQAKADAKAAASGSNDDPLKNVIAVMNVVMSTLEKVIPRIAASKAADKKTTAAHDLVDVAGYNYAQRRYRKDATLHPGRVIVGTETTGPQLNEHWREIEELPHVIGDFVWAGWDYIGEAGVAVKQYNQPRRIFLPHPALLAGLPIIDITGHRQTQSYVNEIVWRDRTRPLIAVQPVDHSGEKTTSTSWRASNSIASWSWEGLNGRTAVVEVYADSPRVELQLNGRSIGTKRADQSTKFLATFRVPYEPGTLTAIAFDESGSEMGRDVLTSADPASLRLQVQPEVAQLVADGNDLLYVPIELTDDAGVLRPLADRPITIEVAGAARLLGFGSANPITPEGFADSTHSTYKGRALAVIRSGHESGNVEIAVSAAGAETVRLTIPVVEVRTAEAARM